MNKDNNNTDSNITNVNFRSRKFLMALGLITLSSSMVFTKHATFVNWSAFNKWIFGLYVSGNVSSHLSNNFIFQNKNIPIRQPSSDD